MANEEPRPAENLAIAPVCISATNAGQNDVDGHCAVSPLNAPVGHTPPRETQMEPKVKKRRPIQFSLISLLELTTAVAVFAAIFAFSPIVAGFGVMLTLPACIQHVVVSQRKMSNGGRLNLCIKARLFVETTWISFALLVACIWVFVVFTFVGTILCQLLIRNSAYEGLMAGVTLGNEAALIVLASSAWRFGRKLRFWKTKLETVWKYVALIEALRGLLLLFVNFRKLQPASEECIALGYLSLSALALALTCYCRVPARITIVTIIVASNVLVEALTVAVLGPHLVITLFLTILTTGLLSWHFWKLQHEINLISLPSRIHRR